MCSWVCKAFLLWLWSHACEQNHKFTRLNSHKTLTQRAKSAKQPLMRANSAQTPPPKTMDNGMPQIFDKFPDFSWFLKEPWHSLHCVFQTFYDLSEGTGRRFNTHMAGDDSGLGVRSQRHDSVSGLSQDRAGFLATQDPLREEERERERGLKV